MEFTERQIQILVDLVKIAWNTGAVRSPDQARELNEVARLLTEKKEA